MSDSKGAAIEGKINGILGRLTYQGYYTEADTALILALLAQEVNTDEVTRFEVIDHRTRLGGGVAGRILVIDPRSPQELPAKVELSLQDDGRTLKVFVSDRKAGLG